MATEVIMPALEMAQESGILVAWLKRQGQTVTKGEPIMEIETDKVTVEIEAPASGVLDGILAHEGEVIPVGQTIAWILAAGEKVPDASPVTKPPARASSAPARGNGGSPTGSPGRESSSFEASPLARRVAEEHGLDLSLVQPAGKRIEKADVLAFINTSHPASESPAPAGSTAAVGRILASPKARRLAAERGVDLAGLKGSGPEGAVLAADVPGEKLSAHPAADEAEAVGTVWRVMAERMSASWTSVPHFYLVREIDAANLMEWRKRVSARVEQRAGVKPTYTDLLVKLAGAVLRDHPRLNAAWVEGNIRWNQEINVGIATAIEDGLVVPVIRRADAAALSEIAVQRQELVERAQNHHLRPADISGGTFTLTNLGMYHVDAFDAIVNAPQAAILAVGRIVERVVPWNGQVMIRARMILTLSCDHRVVDGARAAKFLDDLAGLAEDPWNLLA